MSNPNKDIPYAKEKFLVIVAGSRDVEDPSITLEAMTVSGIFTHPGLEIVSGMARGPDTHAKDYAEANGIKVHPFPCTRQMWNTLGKKAGVLRNIEMGKVSDGLVAAWDGVSTGTAQMIKWAEKNGLWVYIHKVEPLPESEKKPKVDWSKKTRGL